jgi:hypothetical protein
MPDNVMVRLLFDSGESNCRLLNCQGKKKNIGSKCGNAGDVILGDEVPDITEVESASAPRT